MKTYAELTALTKVERETELENSAGRVVFLNESKAAFQKVVAKILVAMIAAGDCQPGDMKGHAEKIAKCDIREQMQDTYPLVKVFTAILAGAIDMTEEDFDTLDASKLALLGPFLTKPELKEKLGEAVQAAKTGTAKDIRELKPKADKKKADEPPAPGATIPVGFAATDIGAGDALVKSKQVLIRLMEDFKRAQEANDGETLGHMLTIFGKCYVTSCNLLGEDPLDYIAELVAKDAKPANAMVVEPTAELAAA